VRGQARITTPFSGATHLVADKLQLRTHAKDRNIFNVSRLDPHLLPVGLIVPMPEPSLVARVMEAPAGRVLHLKLILA
jgi:hypothetical protein